jgi:hypothetical protein
MIRQQMAEEGAIAMLAAKCGRYYQTIGNTTLKRRFVD